MKKVFDQTVRDLKRGVNKKVLKVPSIEQKVLDATSNEPWGPHGSLLADIAQASRNYHEYQMIMTVIWKRISSSGKNWRHVYKALTVLDYLVANGSERVIDEIREHAYQISTLSNFQYIDSSGRDQGLNVRRKSQGLVSLVNDKEKIQEAREKAAVNKDKFRSASTGEAHRYDDESLGRYGSRDEERYGYARDGDWNSRDEDRYGRYGDSNAGDGVRYGKGSYRDDDYRGRDVDENQYGPRNPDKDRDHAYDDEHQSSRGSSVREDHPQEGRPLEQKSPEQNRSAPPSYEEAVGESKSPVYSERYGETPPAPAPKVSSPTASISPVHATIDPMSSWSDPGKADAFDAFDPRGSIAGTSNTAETDLIGSLSDSLVITPSSSAMPSADPNPFGSFAESNFVNTSAPHATVSQSFEDPFGDSPFKAIPAADDTTTQEQNLAPVSSLHQMPNNFGNSVVPETFSSLTFSTPEPSTFQLPLNSQETQHESQPFQNDDILAGILPPSAPVAASHTPFPPPAGQPLTQNYNAPDFVPQLGSQPSNPAPQMPTGVLPQQSNSFLGDLLPQTGPTVGTPSRPVSMVNTGSLALASQPAAKQRFEPKSAVWADTLSRGLVDLNISGSKVNPNSDIGIDFDSLNRKEKRMEKPTTAPATSTITMGKAMGSGSGVGRSSASMLRAPSSATTGPSMGMGMGPMGGYGQMNYQPTMGMGMGANLGIGGYGPMNQPPTMGMGVGGNMSMGMGQGAPMQPSNGSNISGYNPMVGRVGYPSQQPYGSGYQ